MKADRRNLRPLEQRQSGPVIRSTVTLAELLPELRAHFPDFEAELRHETDGIGFEMFKDDNHGALGLLFVLVGISRKEFFRRCRFATSLIRAGPRATPTDPIAQAERFAIQNEEGGTEPRGQHQTIRGPATTQENPLADPTRVPARPPDP